MRERDEQKKLQNLRDELAKGIAQAEAGKVRPMNAGQILARVRKSRKAQRSKSR